jgi:hypothetical protein
MPLMLGSFLGYGVIMARGLNSIGLLHDLQPMLGLNAFVHGRGRLLRRSRRA